MAVVLKDLLPAIFPLFLGRCELIQFLLQPTGDQSINGTPQSTHQHICLEHLILASRHCYLSMIPRSIIKPLEAARVVQHRVFDRRPCFLGYKHIAW
ncbi:unnamed protein product [Thlaspi arvense]|uniref:Secreted protein n=1 Tax=Thlaspi arvense TaxID=13288 RepID=A0AAU9RY24_THLAR|nr:unnamed protein product [Thlaspi arvense]